MNESVGQISLGRKLEIDRFRPSGFDYMRLILALSVLIPHSALVAQGEAYGVWFFAAGAPYFKLILPAFFALSGFLVAGSMERSKTLVTFLGLRVIRIYPALMVEVILSALLIGPFVTTLPLGDYFTDPKFFHYLVNVTGHITYYLPGVFTTNPKPDIVNLQLWTVPWELICYLSLTALILVGGKRSRHIVLAGLAFAFVAGIVVRVVLPALKGADTFVPLTGHVWGPELVLNFLCGVTIYLYRDVLPWNRWWGLAALALSVLLLQFAPAGQYLSILPIGYATVFLGLCNPKRHRFAGVADYSYGVYLYGFVVQQFVAYALPFTRVWYLNLLFAVPLSLLCGVVSWHLVEKPAAGLREPLKKLEAAWLRLKARFPAPWS